MFTLTINDTQSNLTLLDNCIQAAIAGQSLPAYLGRALTDAEKATLAGYSNQIAALFAG